MLGLMYACTLDYSYNKQIKHAHCQKMRCSTTPLGAPQSRLLRQSVTTEIVDRPRVCIRHSNPFFKQYFTVHVPIMHNIHLCVCYTALWYPMIQSCWLVEWRTANWNHTYSSRAPLKWVWFITLMMLDWVLILHSITLCVMIIILNN